MLVHGKNQVMDAACMHNLHTKMQPHQQQATDRHDAGVCESVTDWCVRVCGQRTRPPPSEAPAEVEYICA